MFHLYFKSAPEAGTLIGLFEGSAGKSREIQRYEFAGQAQHLDKKGKPAVLLTWRTQCHCGGSFLFSTGLTTRWFKRLCKPCSAAWAVMHTGEDGRYASPHAREDRPRQEFKFMPAEIDPASLF